MTKLLFIGLQGKGRAGVRNKAISSLWKYFTQSGCLLYLCRQLGIRSYTSEPNFWSHTHR